MEDENRGKNLDLNQLARLARVGLADPHGLGLRDEGEGVLNGVHRIGLRRTFEGLVDRTRFAEGGERTGSGPGC